jgi:hypothetical protein
VSRKKSKRRQRHKQRSARRPLVDPRLVSAQVTHQDGTPVEGNQFIVALSPLRLESGAVLLHQAPLSPAFYLLTAKELRDRGERERQSALRRVVPELSEFGDLYLPDHHAPILLDGLGRLASAVVLAAAAIEAFANELIDRLDSTAVVVVERRKEEVEIAQPDMVRRLSTEEKLHLVAPLATGKPSIKGRAIWGRFKQLSKLRDEVVHLKERGRTPDPDEPGVFGQILLGGAASCVEEAAAVIDACEPGGSHRRHVPNSAFLRSRPSACHVRSDGAYPGAYPDVRKRRLAGVFESVCASS